MNQIDDADHPTLVLMRGLPGSGKSYLTDTLQETIGKDRVVVLDPDATDYKSKEYLDHSKKMLDDGIEEKFHPYRFLRSRAYKAIENNQIIIWNQGFTNLDGFQKTILNLQTYATDHGTELPLLVVEVEINHDVAKARVAKRAAEGGHDVPEEAFTRFINDYRTFATEGYNPVVINGEDDVQASAATIVDAIKALQKK